MKVQEILHKYKQAFWAFFFMFPFIFIGNYVSKEIDKYKDYIKNRHVVTQMQEEQVYVDRASRIVDYYYRQGTPVRFSVVKKTLEAIDYYLPHYFPDGPFTNKDLIAMAMVESSFQQYLVGTSGEKGIFQIMEDMSNAMGVKKNQFDIETNTELGLFVLKEKYNQFPDYRKAIIAYNGVVIHTTVSKNGKQIEVWNDKYWKAFSKAKTDLDIMLKASMPVDEKIVLVKK